MREYTQWPELSIGFESLFGDTQTQKNQAYPPHNLIKVGPDHHILELAVAGFSEEDLDITLKESELLVSGEKKDERAYIHKGIGNRKFSKKFILAEFVEVNTVNMVNGILTIDLVRVIPEEKKARKIKIGAQSNPGFLAE